LIGNLIESVDEFLREKYIEDLTSSLDSDFIQTPSSVCDDLFYNNPIQRCFDDLKMRRKSCNALIIRQLNEPKSQWVHARMMMILPLVLKKKENSFEDFGQFFEDYSGRQDKTAFSIKLSDISLPDFASKNEKRRRLKNTEFGNVIDNRAAIEQLVIESINDPKVK
jgi:hypothetical protein